MFCFLAAGANLRYGQDTDIRDFRICKRAALLTPHFPSNNQIDPVRSGGLQAEVRRGKVICMGAQHTCPVRSRTYGHG